MCSGSIYQLHLIDSLCHSSIRGVLSRHTMLGDLCLTWSDGRASDVFDGVSVDVRLCVNGRD